MKQKNDIKLSIICPIYNAEKNISVLLDSILKQKNDNYELILINDGSKDNTMEILNKYKNKYPNITLIDKENEGVSNTRNRGIDIAKGEYITFFDSDDFISDKYFETVMPLLNNVDLLCFNAYKVQYNTKEPLIDMDNSSINFEGGKNGVINYLEGEYLYRLGNVVWNKIYRKDIIIKNNIRFKKDKKSGEDLVFNVIYISKIHNIKYIDNKLYYYILNRVISENYNPWKIEDNMLYYKYFKEVLEDLELPYNKYIGLFLLRRFPGIVRNEAKSKDKHGLKRIIMYLHDKNIRHCLNSLRFLELDKKMKLGYIYYHLRIYIIDYFIKKRDN